RIVEEAERSGEPLDEQERDLLHNLPTTPNNPTLSSWRFADEYSLPTPILRDFRFERLCLLAKNARLTDTRTRQGAAPQWGFAAAILELNRHPMYWLLQWSGVKKRRPAG